MLRDLENKLDEILANPLASTMGRTDGIGLVGLDLPEDLFQAIDRPVVQLPRHITATQNEVNGLTSQWLESSFAPWTHLVLQNWAAGAYDHLSEVIFSRGCDNAQRLYYYICELQRRGDINGPKPLVFDIAKINRGSSFARTKTSIVTLIKYFGLSDLELKAGIKKANQKREILSSLQNARTDTGALFEKISRACFYEDITPILSGFAPRNTDNKRVLLAGSTPQNGDFHSAIDAIFGWVIAGEFNEHSLLRYGNPIEADEDIAAQMAENILASPLGPRSFADNSQALIDAAYACKADCVILWLAHYDEALAWHIPAQKRALEKAGISYGVFVEPNNTVSHINSVTSFIEGQV